MLKYPPRRTFYRSEGAPERPIVALDIDGTLGEYYEHFLIFARAWSGKHNISTSYDGSVPMNKWCGMSKTMYRECKMAYRRGGLKRSMPTYSGARELTVAVRKRGALVYICTTRPFLSLESVEPDTLHWLKRNGIQYDYVLQGENKYRDLARRVSKSRVVMVLEDLDEMLRQATSLGLPAVRRVNGHNLNSTLSVEAQVHSLPEAQGVALARIGIYERQFA